MTGLQKRQSRPLDLFDLFEDWTGHLPARWPMVRFGAWPAEQMMSVDEFRENGDLVIRAEVPGMDPEKDVEVTVKNGMLEIRIPAPEPAPAKKVEISTS